MEIELARAASAESPARIDLFEDRYGAGAQARLIELLRQPCVSFAEIANRFGVTRECVRQWHQRLLPDAPTGHARQHLCRMFQHRQRLLTDPLFKGFFRHVRRALPERRLTLIPARGGYRKRVVSLDGCVILLRRVRPHRQSSFSVPRYALSPVVADVAFIYFELSSGDYLFVPRSALTANGVMFVDDGRSSLARYKNGFCALEERAGDRGMTARSTSRSGASSA